jgi:hypothetical protein
MYYIFIMETFVKGFCLSRTHCKASIAKYFVLIIKFTLSLQCKFVRCVSLTWSCSLWENVKVLSRWSRLLLAEGWSLCFRRRLVWFLFSVSCLEHGSPTTMILPNATCSSCILQHCCLFPQCCTYLAGVFRTRLVCLTIPLLL